MIPENIRIGEAAALLVAVSTAVWFGGVKLGDIEQKVEHNSNSIRQLEEQMRDDRRDILEAIERTRLEAKADRQFIIQELKALENRFNNGIK